MRFGGVGFEGQCDLATGSCRFVAGEDCFEHGAPIFAGLQTNFTTEFVATGALAVLLAISADVLLVGVQRVLTPWARARRPAT